MKVCSECFCARCARQGRTCCQVSDIFVGPRDLVRIRAFTGLADIPSDLVAPTDPSYFPDPARDPVWAARAFGRDGRRRILRRTPEGDCPFLGDEGCVLPVEVRPLVCRLYPFQYDHRGITGVLPDRCPVALLLPGEHLLEALAMSLDDARRWREELYAELERETGPATELLPDGALTPASEVRPAVRP